MEETVNELAATVTTPLDFNDPGTWANLPVRVWSGRSPYFKFCKICGTKFEDGIRYIRRGNYHAHLTCVRVLKAEKDRQ